MEKQVYETYTPKLVSKTTNSDGTIEEKLIDNSGIIGDIKRVEAVCEIKSSTNNFSDIKLGKNEVIKFRAPNLITTQTFPAYVYYRFEKGKTTMISGSEAGDTDHTGKYATEMQLISFINEKKNNLTAANFFNRLFDVAGDGIKTFKATSNDSGFAISQAGQLTDIFNSAIAVKADIDFNTANPGGQFYSEANKLQEDLKKYFETPGVDKKDITFTYYPLYDGTMSTWSMCIREYYTAKNPGKVLPGNTTLWRLSSTSSHPKGKLVIETGQRLYAQSGEFLQNNKVGEVTFICTDLGADPIHSKVTENSDLELRGDDKLFIHYTPSSTNEDGETVNAEPVSLVFTGGDADNPVILRPSGFTLMPSEDVYRQGTSWKKTDVDFGAHGKKNLLALAPNEQIEMRSISRVILDKPARFYKNFDNTQLELGSTNASYSYELKDGEYLFYTDQNTQEAAYYGSGSVITVAGGANIPKATEPIEVAEILNQGLHIVPWSSYVNLNSVRKITITEYQYVTLTEGDTLNTLTIEGSTEGGYTLNNTRWAKCISTDETPVVYTTAGSDTSSVLPKIDLASSSLPDSDSSVGWEVCSLLELSTSPGYSQPLSAANITPIGAPTTNISITDKVNIILSTNEKIEIIPQPTVSPSTAGVETQAVYVGSNDNLWIDTADTGVAVPYIDENGFLYINNIRIGSVEDSEKNKKFGLGENGNWFLGDTDMGILAAEVNDETNEWFICINNLVTTLDVTLVEGLNLADIEDIGTGIQKELIIPADVEAYEPISIKLDTIAQVASGSFEKGTTNTDTTSERTTLQMKVFKEEQPKLVELTNINDTLTPISMANIHSVDIGANDMQTKLSDYWTQINIRASLWRETSSDTEVSLQPRAAQLNFMIPNENDIFGIFSIYLAVDNTDADAPSTEGGDEKPSTGVFIEVPSEFGSHSDVISIYNYTAEGTTGGEFSWWSDGERDNRLYLKPGLNCIKVAKSCSILIKADEDVFGNILYDDLRLVKGIKTHGINLALLNPNMQYAESLDEDTKVEMANNVLSEIKKLDKNHEFYYNVPVENSLAIEFDDNISSFSNPYTLYDINNVNNSFVVSKLDVDYLDTGLRIAKSSKY